MANVKRRSKSETRPSEKQSENGEYATFETALKKVLSVSHKEMQKRITRASSARASRAKD